MKRARQAHRGKLSTPTVAAQTGRETVAVPVLAPRNPLVAPAQRRKAGVHDSSARQRRLHEKLEIRRLLDE